MYILEFDGDFDTFVVGPFVEKPNDKEVLAAVNYYLEDKIEEAAKVGIPYAEYVEAISIHIVELLEPCT